MPEVPLPELAHAALGVLEEMGFLLGGRSDAQRLEPPLAPMHARLEFRGASCGALEVVTSAALARNLAGGVLGRAVEELDAEHAGAALGELVNVLLGHLREWLGPMRVPLESGLPAVVPAACAADWDELVLRPGSVVLEVEGEPLALAVRIDSVQEVKG